MHSSFLLAALAAATSANVIPEAYRPQALDVAAALTRRMLPNAPNKYVPTAGDCPSDRPALRDASGLSTQERDWLSVRRNQTIPAMRNFINRVAINGFDANNYFNAQSGDASALPNVGIAVSGGGYRALMNGAGILSAFDERTTNSTSAGGVGGVLQSATYLAGLSGGGWLVSSLFANNFTTVESILASPNEPWAFENNLIKGPPSNGISLLSTAGYWGDVDDQVSSKSDAGYNTSITDYWGRALSYQLINATDGGISYTYSSLAQQDLINRGQAPLPILIADGRAPGQKIIPANTTIYEFNPWEMGSWDPTVYGFAPLEYVGSNFSGGSLPAGQQCVRGFDNAGYVLGTSSTLFNQAIFYLNQSTSLPNFVNNAIANVLEDLGDDSNDIADWTPNPFYGYHNGSNLNSQSKRLTLVDGGEDGQNVPLHPLIQPYRALDVIFAVDSSADTIYNWPNGTSLVATYERSLNSSIQNGTAFPYIPDQNTFINDGLSIRPTFFGCNASNFTRSTDGRSSPLIVYLPNSFVTFQSNFSTFDPSYSREDRNRAILNGYNVATRANNTLGNKDWPVCVACAMLARSFDRTGTAYPSACNSCFQEYCWNGKLSSQAVSNSTLNQTASTPQGNSTDGKSAAGPPVTPGMAGVMSVIMGTIAVLLM